MRGALRSGFSKASECARPATLHWCPTEYPGELFQCVPRIFLTAYGLFSLVNFFFFL